MSVVAIRCFGVCEALAVLSVHILTSVVGEKVEDKGSQRLLASSSCLLCRLFSFPLLRVRGVGQAGVASISAWHDPDETRPPEQRNGTPLWRRLQAEGSV